MPNLLQNGASWLVGKLSDKLSQTVTYRRGAKTLSIAATKMPVTSEVDSQFGILRIGECDWIIKASLITFGDPAKNDVIEEDDGAQWQVLPLAGEAEFKPLDQFGNGVLIHTKRIEAPG